MRIPVLALLVAAFAGCAAEGPGSAHGRPVRSVAPLEPFSIRNPALTDKDLRVARISFVCLGDFCGLRVSLAVPTRDGGYDVRLETMERDFAGRRTFKIAECALYPRYADQVRAALAVAFRTPSADDFPRNIFVEKADGTILPLNGPDDPGRDIERFEAGRMLLDALMEVPLNGEPSCLRARREEIRLLLATSRPDGGKPHLIVYDVASICDGQGAVEALAESIRATVAPGSWSPEARTGVSACPGSGEAAGFALEEMNHEILMVQAAPQVQRQVRSFLEARGLAGAALEPLTPRTVPPARKFSVPSITTLHSQEGDPFPEELRLIPPVRLSAAKARALSAAQLYMSIAGDRRFTPAVLSAIRCRECPPLTLGVIAKLLIGAEEDGHAEEAAELMSVAERWQSRVPWTFRYTQGFGIFSHWVLRELFPRPLPYVPAERRQRNSAPP